MFFILTDSDQQEGSFSRSLTVHSPGAGMGTAASRVSELLSSLEPVVPPRGPLLLASDGSPASDAAFPMTRALAAQTGCAVQVLSAVTPRVMPTYVLDSIPIPTEPLEPQLEHQQESIHGQMERLALAEVPWDVIVRAGDPVREIIQQAEEVEARLIVVGRGKLDLIDRLLGGESVLRLLQLGETPVFAVSSELEVLARRVVIATDFSAFSVYAAQVAMDFIASDAHVELVHVAPSLGGSAPMLREFAEEYRTQAASAFSRMVTLLNRPGMTFDTTLLEGNASTRLVEHLEAVKADLVVTSTHGYGFLRRMILGSVTAGVIRTAPCSVLCVPGSARTLAERRAQVVVEERRTRRIPAADLAAELDAFSERNSGRFCRLEVRLKDIGAQSFGRHLPFGGVSLDTTNRNIVLTLSNAEGEGFHFTHQVPGGSQVDMVVNPDGSDCALRMTNSGGETRLELE